MQVVSSVDEVRVTRREWARVGLVPTMGALHEGHLTLVRRAKQECGAAAVSIFVNPRQFGPGEDLDAYPRDLDGDLEKLRQAGADLVWTPTPEVMYPPGYDTNISVGGLTGVLEGASRPGHFDGVATVVTKLFNVFTPTDAYFGAKDAQQLAVIRKLVRDLDIPVTVHGVPIVREDDGLAMSSRNVYLDPAQRAAAVVLSRSVAEVRRAWEGGERSADVLRDRVREILATEPLGEPDYVSVADPSTLAELARVDPAVGALVSLAVRFGRTRLLDNTLLEPRDG